MFVMGDDGEDGCRIAFLAKEYAAAERGLTLNGAIVRTVDVYLPNNRTGQHIIFTTTIVVTLLAKLLPHTTTRVVINVLKSEITI